MLLVGPPLVGLESCISTSKHPVWMVYLREHLHHGKRQASDRPSKNLMSAFLKMSVNSMGIRLACISSSSPCMQSGSEHGQRTMTCMYQNGLGVGKPPGPWAIDVLVATGSNGPLFLQEVYDQGWGLAGLCGCLYYSPVLEQGAVCLQRSGIRHLVACVRVKTW